MMPMMAWFGTLTWLLYALLLILAASGVAAWVASARVTMIGPGPDEEILRMRYATGDIDTDEYRTRLAVLHSPDGLTGVNRP
jgi:uncharacterized membrane protein